MGKKDQTSDFLAHQLSDLWPNLSAYSTKISFLWGHKRDPRYASCDMLLLHEEVQAGLAVQSDRGLKMSHECFEDNQYNRSILGDLVPYVNIKPRGYNRELLLCAEMKGNVALYDILALIKKWYQETKEGERSSKAFEPYLLAVEHLSAINEELIPELQTKILLYSESMDKLLSFDEWCSSIGSGEYIEELVSKLKNNFNLRQVSHWFDQ